MATETGYDPKFLGKPLPLPKLKTTDLAPLLHGNGREIKFTHFSVFVNQERRLPQMAVVNIRGEEFSAETREGSEPWKLSDDVEEAFQIDNRFYGHDDGTFDRGHLIRRVDPCWGNKNISDKAEADTFTWVNCTPQHKKLNRMNGIWYQLEQHIIEHGVKNKIGDVSVFSGPVLSKNDPIFKKQYEGKDVPIPLLFWKVIVWRKTDGKLYAVGFMMNQYEWVKKMVTPVKRRVVRGKPKVADDYFEKLKFKDNKTYQVPVKDIEKVTGIKFGWKSVVFPKVAKATEVRGIPLKKVYNAHDVLKAKSRASKKTRGPVSPRSVENELKKETPVPQKKVEELIDKGEAYRLKRFKISNIKL